VTTIAIARPLAEQFGERILAADPRVTALPVRGEEDEAGLDEVEIAVSLHYEGPLTFAELIERMPRLRWIHSTGAGMDDFVSPRLAERGVVVTNSSGIWSPAMVEFAIAGMVAIARDFKQLFADQEARRWAHAMVAGRELRGTRLGIVGYGATGRALATACRALGMEVWATRRKPSVDVVEPIDRLVPLDDLHELLRECDHVVVLASLNSTSRHLLGRDEFAAMKNGAVLVNLSRGGLVDPDALLDALRGGHLAGAVIDVTEPEPLPPESPLWSAPNLILSPHVSGNSPEGLARSIDLFCSNLPLFLDGHVDRMGNLVDLADHL
jgi:phosphoglycerate dehydrogenase-like enzyme